MVLCKMKVVLPQIETSYAVSAPLRMESRLPEDTIEAMLHPVSGIGHFLMQASGYIKSK